jgi:hypothetical protein
MTETLKVVGGKLIAPTTNQVIAALAVAMVTYLAVAAVSSIFGETPSPPDAAAG